MFNATLCQVEIIGEVGNRLSDDVLNDNPNIYWARIIRLRNLVIHEHFATADITIWNVIKKFFLK